MVISSWIVAFLIVLFQSPQSNGHAVDDVINRANHLADGLLSSLDLTKQDDQCEQSALYHLKKLLLAGKCPLWQEVYVDFGFKTAQPIVIESSLSALPKGYTVNLQGKLVTTRDGAGFH